MATTLISAAPAGAASHECSKAVDSRSPYELVKAFGERVFAIAKHITQDDDDAEYVLIQTFLEVCEDWDGSRKMEKLWLRVVTVAVNEAFSKVRRRAEGGALPGRVSDPCDDLVAREFFIWGDDYRPSDSRGRTVSGPEDALRTLDLMARTIFVLRDIEQISVEHIARLVNRSVPAVEVCLLRARLELGEALARQMRQTA